MFGNRVLGRRLFSSLNKRIAIMGNSNSADVAGARFMNALAKVSGHNDFEYFGIGGHRMIDAGLPESEIDTNNFLDKPMYTWRKTRQTEQLVSKNRWDALNPINIHARRNGMDVLAALEETNFFHRVYSFRPSVIVSLDNEFFSMQASEKLGKFYYNTSVTKPQRHYYNRFVKDLRRYHEHIFDYMHFTIPKVTALAGGYRFPAQFVGQHGVYDTLRHLLKSDPEQSAYVGKNTISLSEKHFAADIDRSIQKVRSTFREKHNIDEDTTVIFFSPGNEENEALFSLASVRKGVEEFLLKYSAPTSLSPVAKPMDKFHTIISVEGGSNAETYVNKELEECGWKGSFEIVSDYQNEYIDAMAASDIGIMYDGQMVGQAAA